MKPLRPAERPGQPALFDAPRDHGVDGPRVIQLPLVQFAQEFLVCVRDPIVATTCEFVSRQRHQRLPQAVGCDALGEELAEDPIQHVRAGRTPLPARRAHADPQGRLPRQPGHQHSAREDSYRTRLDPEHVTEIGEEGHRRVQPSRNAGRGRLLEKDIPLYAMREQQEVGVARGPGQPAHGVEKRLRAGRPQRGIRVRTNESKGHGGNISRPYDRWQGLWRTPCGPHVDILWS